MPPEGATVVRHLCDVNYVLSLDYDWDETPNPDGHTQSAHSQFDSTYEHPIVAACCTDLSEQDAYSAGDDTCPFIHHAACVGDLLEHICAGPEKWLLAKSPGQFEDLGAHNLHHAAAQWFRDNEQTCYNSFWTGMSDLHDDDFCDPFFDEQVNFTWLPVFADDHPTHPGLPVHFETALGGMMSGFSLSVLVELGGNLPQVPPSNPIECNNPDANDGETPPFAQPGSGGFTALATSPSMSLWLTGPSWSGEVISGSGRISPTTSSLRYDWSGGDLLLSDWYLPEAGPTIVGTSAATSSVEDFSVRLLKPVTLSPSGGLYVASPQDVRFALQATVDMAGESRVAANADRLMFYRSTPGMGDCPVAASECLINRPFTISYLDAWGDEWELDMPSATWAR